MIKKTVLVMDAWGDNITRISAAIRPFACGLLWAENLDEAIKLIQEARPNIIIVADDFPSLPCPCKLLAILDTLKLPSQIIAMTREPNFTTAMDLVTNGIFAVVSSPVEPEKLRNIVRRVLDNLSLFNSMVSRSPLESEKELAIYKSLAGHQELIPLLDSIRKLTMDLLEGVEAEVELSPELLDRLDNNADEAMFNFEIPPLPTQPHLFRELVWKGVCFGKLNISFSGDPVPIQEEVLDEIVWAASLHLFQAQKFHDAVKLASKDPLTGLFNRRVFMETLDREFAKAKRHNTPLSLLTLDIDHFKSVNDTFGHQTGDRVLKWLAKIIRSTIRVGDIACRVGGEEFAIILPWTEIEQAQNLAARLKEALASSSKPTNLEILRPTVSQGISTLEHFLINSSEDLIYWSDQAMYLAKKEGRNTVRLATDLGTKTKLEDSQYAFQ
ncbi:MAG: diguanylate cyclase [Deltaproteobacteria bacterium]|jgi:diguanylate cyclase (GGDEF)-like protein|nr:diguanylate cyclase [Deltaproteobacteria bacterium]